MVLKLVLLASHMTETVFENFIFAKQRAQTLHVTLFNLCYVFHIVFSKHKMVYYVACSCAKKHTSNTNDYIWRVSAVKIRSETTTAPRKWQTNGQKDIHGAALSSIDLCRPHVEEPRASTELPFTEKYHFILIKVMR